MNGNYYPQPPPMGMPYQQTQYYAQPPPSAYPPQYAPQPYAPMPPQQYPPPQPMMMNPRMSFGHQMSHHGMMEIQTDLPPYGYPQQLHHSGPPSPMPMMQPPIMDSYDQELISRSSAMGTSDGDTPPRPKRVNSMKKKTSNEAVVTKKKTTTKKEKEKEKAEEGAFSFSAFEMGKFGPCLFR